MVYRRTALITGANRGIGRAVACRLIDLGFDVLMTGRDAEAVRAALPFREAASVLRLDVSDPESIRAAAEEFGLTRTRLDVLINNAAIAPREPDGIERLGHDEIARVFATNTFGPLHVTQTFWPFLLRGLDARVVNVSSGLASLSSMEDTFPAYSISKTALNAVTRQFAAAGRGQIAVFAVCPGWVRTEMGGPNATRSAEEGAAGIVWAATAAPRTYSGTFTQDGTIVPW